MQRKKILFLGFGDIATRASQLLSGADILGIARSPKTVPANVDFFQAAADSLPVCQRLSQEQWDALVITLTPTEFSDRAYDIAYVQTLARLLEFCQHKPPGKIYFASSTGVYPQSEGEWVDENTVVVPESFSGKRLLEAENLLVESGFPHCILRIAGIYGPGRDVILRQVKQGMGGSDSFTNRIHADDCAGFLAYLLEQQFAGNKLDSLYVVADSTPATGSEVRGWLAQRMGFGHSHLRSSVSERGGNKRCRNARMLSTGYQLRYPDYQSGYRELVPQVEGSSSSS